jgi:hypothetical protein
VEKWDPEVECDFQEGWDRGDYLLVWWYPMYLQACSLGAYSHDTSSLRQCDSTTQWTCYEANALDGFSNG